jgi:hypothetical protein
MNSLLKKSLVGLVGAAALAVPFAGLANAGQPNNPGCFGRDRAAGVAEARNNPIYDSSPGASFWGLNDDGASGRAGDNGTINQAWMVKCQAA